MRKDIHYILVIMSLLLTVSCSEESADDPGLTGEAYAPLQMVGLTRSALGEAEITDIHAFLTCSSEASVTEGKFRYTAATEEWGTQFKLKSGTRTYRLYGYMPDDDAQTSALTSWSDGGAVMRIENINPLTLDDYCIVTGVRQVETATDKTAATRGHFSFEYRSNRQNYINLLLDHMMSRLVFSMKVNTAYNALRTIKIKKMSLKLASLSNMTVDVTLADGAGISAISYTPTGTSENTCIIADYSAEEVKTLTTNSTAICSAYVVPASALINGLQLVTEFDVYDKEGKKIAERTATNLLKKPLEELQRGEERTLLITVDPTYLYVLSDGDLNNPKVIVER